MRYKIPIIVEVSVLVEIEADSFDSALVKATELSTVDGRLEGEELTSSEPKLTNQILLVDDERLKQMYPLQVQEECKSYWEKKGWCEHHNCWKKEGVTITNDFNDVGFGFCGTVHFPNGWSKSGFDSLEDAIDFAELPGYLLPTGSGLN